MSRQDWFILCLCYLLFAEGLSWIAASGPPPCLIQVEHTQELGNQGDQKYCATFFAGMIIVVERTVDIIKSHDNDKAIVAAFTIVLGLSTIGLWIATFGLQRSTKKLWEAGEKQISLAQQDFSATHRPWVSVQVLIGPRGIYFDVNGANLDLVFICKNTGSTPAIGVWVEVQPFLQRPGRQELEEQRRACDALRSRPYHPMAPGTTIFPGDTVPFNYTYSFIGKADLEMAMSEMHGFIFPVVVGCVDYIFAFGERAHHQTGFIYHVHKVNPPAAGHLAISPADGDVGATNLRLTTALNGGGFFAD
jgi:hypothetical protein